MIFYPCYFKAIFRRKKCNYATTSYLYTYMLLFIILQHKLFCHTVAFRGTFILYLIYVESFTLTCFSGSLRLVLIQIKNLNILIAAPPFYVMVQRKAFHIQLDTLGVTCVKIYILVLVNTGLKMYLPIHINL